MVVTFNIQIRGINRLNKFMVELGPQLNKAIREEGLSFLKDVQKSAKLRAPRFTGQLAQSVKVLPSDSKKEIGRIIVDSPYGIFQEEGFTPHVVHSGMHTRAGARIADWMSSKGKGRGYMTVRGFKPFIKPALEHNINRLSTKMSQAFNKAVKRSKT